MEKTSDLSQKLHLFLQQYRLNDPHLKMLQNHGSLVVQVMVGTVSYVLRVCEPTTPAAHVQEELDWLFALRRETDLLAPSPVANDQGTYITPWIASEGDPVHLCVLFNWVEGEAVGPCLSLEGAGAIGSLIGQLHHHAQAYTPAATGGFVGPRYDLTWLIGPTSWWSSGRARHDLGGETYGRLVPALEIAAEAMRRQGEAPEHFGIIHHDLHFGNIMVNTNRYGVIAFGDCSLGHYLHDLAIVEQDFRETFNDPGYLTAFHQHYYQERGMAQFSPHDLEASMIWADVVFLEWILSTDILEARDYGLPLVPEKIEHIIASAERAKHML